MARGCAVLTGMALACAACRQPADPAEAALSDCRAILSAEARYAKETGAGHPAPLACLVDPRPCVPGRVCVSVKPVTGEGGACPPAADCADLR